MKDRAFIDRVDFVWPISKQNKGAKATTAKNIEKVIIRHKNYIVAKGSCKVGDQVVVIPVGSVIGLKHDWFKFLKVATIAGENCYKIHKYKVFGVTSNGLVIPLADYPLILEDVYKDGQQPNSLDFAFKVSKILTKDEQEELRICNKEIVGYKRVIRRILSS